MFWTTASKFLSIWFFFLELLFIWRNKIYVPFWALWMFIYLFTHDLYYKHTKNVTFKYEQMIAFTKLIGDIKQVWSGHLHSIIKIHNFLLSKLCENHVITLPLEGSMTIKDSTNTRTQTEEILASLECLQWNLINKKKLFTHVEQGHRHWEGGGESVSLKT